jgi:predicted adenylyl cyclase CyaB
MTEKHSIKGLINEAQKFADAELQIKLKCSISDAKLREIKAIRLGTVNHEDIYFIKKNETVRDSSELIRVRKEGAEEMIFTFKGPISKLGGNKLVKRIILDRKLNKEHILDIKKNYKEIIKINKQRTMFLYDGILICVDNVEHLGDFIEFTIRDEHLESKMQDVVSKLGLDMKSATRDSYFELALVYVSPYHRIMHRLIEQTGKLSFGISSGVLTTLGIIVGMNSATASEAAVIGGIAIIAFCDSLSDSMGIYASKRSERGNSSKNAFTSALYTFIGKVIFTMSFMIPFIIFSFGAAVIASIVWGLALLTFVSFEIAFMHEENYFLTIFKNLGTAGVIIIASHYIGHLINYLL